MNLAPDNQPAQSLADRLISEIRTRPNHAWSEDELARTLGVDKASLGEALQTAIEWGYRIDHGGGKVRFISPPDLLTSTEIGCGLKTRFLGKSVLAYRSVKSTNDIALGLAEDGQTEGTLITAEQQTAGRGRFGRDWKSPPQTGIYMSLILRPNFPPDQAPALSLVAALAVAESIEQHCPGQVAVKWPNDVLIDRKKVAGILTELATDNSKIKHVVVGIGINVNQTNEDFPSDLRHKATSIRIALKEKIDRVALIQSILERFEPAYLEYQETRLQSMLTRLRAYSSLIGKKVKLDQGGEIIEAEALDIAPDGGLIVRGKAGTVTVHAGEVSIVEDEK